MALYKFDYYNFLGVKCLAIEASALVAAPVNGTERNGISHQHKPILVPIWITIWVQGFF